MARGHPNAGDYTPRQLTAFMGFYQRDRRREIIEQVRVGRMIHASDHKKVDALLKKWEGEV